MGANPMGLLRGWLAAAQHFLGLALIPLEIFFFFLFSFLLHSCAELEGKLQRGRERFLPCLALGSRCSHRAQ